MNPYLYMFASVGIVSLVSFTGLFLISMREEKLRKILFILVSLAIGALLGDVVFHLIPEAFETIENPVTISTLIIAGILSFFVLERLLRWHHHTPLDDPHQEHTDISNPGYIGRLVLVADGFHNFIDGIIISVSYLVDIQLGIATTLAVILHEIPQEIGDFGVLLHAGYTRSRALLYNLVSALAAFGGALLVVAMGNPSEQLLAYALPFGAGLFIYIANSDLVPELQKSSKFGNIILELISIAIGILAMYALLFLE
jgi:zinc and cadmium transporter